MILFQKNLNPLASSSHQMIFTVKKTGFNIFYTKSLFLQLCYEDLAS